jgi:hypothetical protein
LEIASFEDFARHGGSIFLGVLGFHCSWPPDGYKCKLARGYSRANPVARRGYNREEKIGYGLIKAVLGQGWVAKLLLFLHAFLVNMLQEENVGGLHINAATSGYYSLPEP